MAWPLSFLGPPVVVVGGGLVFGKVVVFDDLDRDGFGFGFAGGYFYAMKCEPAPNPKPVVPGPWLTQTFFDDSHWVGSVRHCIGVGTILEGSPYHADWAAHTGVIFPFWPASLLAGVLLVRAVWKMRRDRRLVEAGRCVACRYDLRAHRAGGRCPECGRVIGVENSSAKAGGSEP